MKDDCYLPAPDFHCKPKYSLTNISEKSWDNARSEFKDQEQGKIPVSCTILNHSYSHCRSSGNSCVALKGWISYPVSINQNLVHGRKPLDTTFLPCALESWDKNEVPRQKTVFAVQGLLCSIRGWDWIGHAVSPCNSMVQAFLALLPLEAEVWITQIVLWLKSPLLPALSCWPSTWPVQRSHRARAHLSCRATVTTCLWYDPGALALLRRLLHLWRFWQEAFWAREAGCLIHICAFVTAMDPTFQAGQKVIDSSRRLSYPRLIELSYEIAALQSVCPLPLWVT